MDTCTYGEDEESRYKSRQIKTHVGNKNNWLRHALRAVSNLPPLPLVIFSQSQIQSTFLCHPEAVYVSLLFIGRQELGSSYFQLGSYGENLASLALIAAASRPDIFHLGFVPGKYNSLGFHSHGALRGHIFSRFRLKRI